MGAIDGVWEQDVQSRHLRSQATLLKVPVASQWPGPPSTVHPRTHVDDIYKDPAVRGRRDSVHTTCSSMPFVLGCTRSIESLAVVLLLNHLWFSHRFVSCGVAVISGVPNFNTEWYIIS